MVRVVVRVGVPSRAGSETWFQSLLSNVFRFASARLIFEGAYFQRGLLLEGIFAFQNGLGLTMRTAKTLRKQPKTA